MPQRSFAKGGPIADRSQNVDPTLNPLKRPSVLHLLILGNGAGGAGEFNPAGSLSDVRLRRLLAWPRSVGTGDRFHKPPEFRFVLKLGLRSDPTRYCPKHFR
jgi:hypothetical protein